VSHRRRQSRPAADGPSGPDERRRSWLVWVGVYLGVAYLLIYLPYGVLLAFTGEQSELPPAWRDPDVPRDARVLSVRDDCSQGVCRREIRIQPAENQSARELAQEMDLTEPKIHGWRWYDPARVTVYASLVSDPLRVYVRYENPFSD